MGSERKPQAIGVDQYPLILNTACELANGLILLSMPGTLMKPVFLLSASVKLDCGDGDDLSRPSVSI